MTIREVFLFTCLVALGVHAFRETRARNQRRLTHLLQSERDLREELKALQERQGSLAREAEALQTDRYYVERVARAQLGWRPVVDPARLVPPAGMPPLADSPAELVLRGPAGGAPQEPSSPAPPGGPTPQPPQLDCDREMIAALGYGSVEDFQRKMVGGRAPGTLDAATRARARRLAETLRRAGFASVKDFQASQGLQADGVLGRESERRLLALARPQPSPRRPGRPSGIVVHNGTTDKRRPGG